MHVIQHLAMVIIEISAKNKTYVCDSI